MQVRIPASRDFSLMKLIGAVTHPRRIAFSVIFMSALLLIRNDARGDCVEDSPTFTQWVRKGFGGVMRDFTVDLYLHANAPGNVNNVDWGEVYIYYTDQGNEETENCTSPKGNCQNQDYTYMTVSINEQWSVSGVMFGTNYTATIDDAERYWDSQFMATDGYTKTESIDYSKNSHGYSTGVGDWPSLDEYGMGTVLAAPNCWVAKIGCPNITLGVVDDLSHSIIVGCTSCNLPYGGPNNQIPTLTFTSEKAYESGVYERATVCPWELNLEPDPRGLSYDYYWKKP